MATEHLGFPERISINPTEKSTCGDCGKTGPHVHVGADKHVATVEETHELLARALTTLAKWENDPIGTLVAFLATTGQTLDETGGTLPANVLPFRPGKKETWN